MLTSQFLAQVGSGRLLPGPPSVQHVVRLVTAPACGRGPAAPATMCRRHCLGRSRLVFTMGSKPTVREEKVTAPEPPRWEIRREDLDTLDNRMLYERLEFWIQQAMLYVQNININIILCKVRLRRVYGLRYTIVGNQAVVMAFSLEHQKNFVPQVSGNETSALPHGSSARPGSSKALKPLPSTPCTSGTFHTSRCGPPNSSS